MSRWKLDKPTTGAVRLREWKKTRAGVAYAKRQAVYARSWRERNPVKFRETQKRCNQKIRLETLTHYGGNPPKCACCGESEIVFLSIDHRDGGGAAHRRQIDPDGKIGGNGFYYWLKKNGWPEGFQVLCYNCNFAKRDSGLCPHQTGAATITQITRRIR